MSFVRQSFAGSGTPERAGTPSNSNSSQPSNFLPPTGTLKTFIVHSNTTSTSVVMVYTPGWYAHQEEAPSTEVSIARIQDYVRTIQDAFGLNTTQLANILGVTRKTVYLWLSGADQKIQERNRHRLCQIAAMATMWRKRSVQERSGKLRAIVGDTTMLELLSAEELDTERIQAVMDALANVTPTHKTDNQRVAEAIKSAAARRMAAAVMPEPGKPIYFTDPAHPGLIVEQHHDGRKVLGKVVGGTFQATDAE